MDKTTIFTIFIITFFPCLFLLINQRKAMYIYRFIVGLSSGIQFVSSSLKLFFSIKREIYDKKMSRKGMIKLSIYLTN